MSKLKIYKASAGSGKTYTLALEYIKELIVKQSNNSHRNILAVTFTKDATGEMKDRILAELYGLASGCDDSKVFMQSLLEALQKAGKPMKEEEIRTKANVVFNQIIHDYSRLYITTIDSFFQKVLRNLARELGKGSKFNIEMNSGKILSEAVKSMIENANDNPQLLEWLTTYIENKLDEGSNWRIEKEIFDFSKCIFNEYFQEHEFVLKKQLESNPAIFEEIWKQQGKIQKDCKDFFRKSYNEIQQILQQRNLDISDFSYKGTTINFFKKLSDGDYSRAEVNKTIEACQTDPEKWTTSKNKRKDEIVTLATMNLIPLLNQSIEILRKFNTSRMITDNLHQLGLIWDITNEISTQNAENNRFMLADTALFLNRMIDDSDAPFIYEKIGAEIKHVMIDEFQDTSRLQWKNFKSLLSEIIANNYFSLIVGDVKQSIYRWRNGDWSILNNIGNELPANIETLSFNYRSEKEIIEFNNQFFTYAAFLLNEKYISLFGNQEKSPFTSAYSPGEVIQQTRKKDNSGYISIDFIQPKTEDNKYPDLVLEQLLRQIQMLRDAGIPAEEICILTRTNKSIISIANYLANQRDANPDLASGNYLNIVSNEAFQLLSSPAVRIIIEALRVLANPDNPVYKAQLHIFLNKLHNQNLNNLDLVLGNQAPFIHEFDDTEKLIQIPLFELIGHLFRLFQLEKMDGQSNYMFTFYDAISAYLKDSPADLHTFLKFWDEELQFKSVPSGTSVEGIRAMTIHKSKGLQFHTVLFPFCDWDIFPEKNPIIWCGSKKGFYDLELLPVKYNNKMHDTIFVQEYENETGQAWMDNLNLLYVAFTRAEHNLLILGKYKKKLETVDDIKNVSDLLQESVLEIEGIFDEENFHFQRGNLNGHLSKKAHQIDNLLKQSPEICTVSFTSKAFNPEKSIFKQSNQSRQFISTEESPSQEYIAYGNTMHSIFSRINTLSDIEPTIQRLSFEGIIRPEEKEKYIQDIKNAITQSNAEDWFSDQYQVYNECEIIIKENNIITHKRPDRVIIKEKEVIIIDYKFGTPRPSHTRQMLEYVDLMKKMNYEKISAYLWYVDLHIKKLIAN